VTIVLAPNDLDAPRIADASLLDSSESDRNENALREGATASLQDLKVLLMMSRRERVGIGTAQQEVRNSLHGAESTT
jgi:hypothetical protein